MSEITAPWEDAAACVVADRGEVVAPSPVEMVKDEKVPKAPKAKTVKKSPPVPGRPPWPLTDYFRKQAEARGMEPEEFAVQMMFDGGHAPVSAGKGKGERMVRWVPATRLGDGRRGPQDCEVMVIGKMPTAEDAALLENFSGMDGSLIREATQKAGLDASGWLATNAVRFTTWDGKVKADHLKDSCALLGQEIALSGPRLLLLVGSEAVKAVCGKNATQGELRSQLRRFDGLHQLGTMPVLEPSGKLPPRPAIGVFATLHPFAVRREEALMEGFFNDFRTLAQILGNGIPPLSERDYRTVESAATLAAVVDEVLEGGFTEIAVDCEWGGPSPMSGKLRSIQFSWKHGSACCVKLLGEGGRSIHDPVGRWRIKEQVRRLFFAPGMRLIGHNFRADALWLAEEGLPVMERFAFDTMLCAHALSENSELGLEACTVRWTDMGRYDLPVAAWLKKNGYTGDRLAERGYLDVPDDLLIPYSNCDADSTLRIKQVLSKRLSQPGNEGVRDLYFGVTLPTTLPIHEAERNGLLADADRMADITESCVDVRNDLLDRIRVETGIPGFNPRSQPQMVEFLFGDPAKKGLGLEPYKTTGKSAVLWEDLLSGKKGRKRDLRDYSPSTDGESMEFLAGGHPDLKALPLICDFKLVDKLITGFIPSWEDIDGKTKSKLSRKALTPNIDLDGRIRTHFSQCSETGRDKSSSPNLQNLSSKQDKKLERILGGRFLALRSCFLAPPGRFLVQADYKSAEIFTLARLACCAKLETAAWGDLHSRTAVLSLGAPRWPGFDSLAPPPEEWKEQHKLLRDGAKVVNFGC